MKFTDLFIRKPVLASVVSLMILVLGLKSLGMLPIREYPFTQNAVVTVTTVYTGADPSLVAGFITKTLEEVIAQAGGIDYLISSSTQGVSTITANLRLNYDPNIALTDITTKVNSVVNLLPPSAQRPVITVTVGDPIASMYMGFYSKDLSSNKITDYLTRVVRPKLQAVPDVQSADILGGGQLAMRIWLDPVKMSAFGVTPNDVAVAITQNNFITAVGRTDDAMVTVNLTADTGLESIETFRNLIIKSKNEAIIYLKDVATVSLGAETYDVNVKLDGQEAVFIGIKVIPAANILTVIENIKKVFPSIQSQLPEGLTAKIVYDATKYIDSSIHEVIRSLLEAVAIVVVVIFVFLGSLRTVIIPLVAIPLSLVGAFFVMFILGYSINLLTLLALVLSIGLVVDDAIIVVENIYRHIENGMEPLEASILGAQELASPIIAISVVLIAVYLPIGFMGGLTGVLFTEFAFTLAATVAVSAVIALTLSPMMCSKLLRGHSQNKFSAFIDRYFGKLEKGYERILHRSLNILPVTGIFSIIIIASIYFLYVNSTAELAPQEDKGFVIVDITGAANANLGQVQLYANQVYEGLRQFPETAQVYQVEGSPALNRGTLGMILKPWDERKQTASQLQPQVQAQLDQITGGKIAAYQLPSLPGSSGGVAVQFVVGTTESFDRLAEVSKIMMEKAEESGVFAYLDSDLKIDKAQTTIELDRDKAALMGFNMQDIGNVLQSALSEGYINFFNFYERSYKVIPQIERNDRINYDQVLNYYLTTKDGTAIPLSTVARTRATVVPQSINHFQQLNSATISAVPKPGITIGRALETLKKIASDNLPQGFSIDYAGESRQYEKEGSSLLVTFFFAIIIIFLALAALFESFRDPLIVLVSVPMSICGAMIFINLEVGGATINIYTQVGLVTLIGLISKHGILIVQFANDLQVEGKNKRDAIEMASALRLRPILMTTFAMVLGVLPLIMATGAGAVSRFSIGLVIVTGVSIGTLFTLFVVPAMYMFMAHELKKNH
ncbi:MAG: efflux RND transporter permease subunit [Alphaproteobacteria bacterium]|nr:efflux RND transporter permease subunit [Alphaproteobacteria bacterium]